MSTYVYLQCLDHDPPLRAEGESGQHLSDLPQIRADIADRDMIARMWARENLDRGHHFLNNTARFLAYHRPCRIGIIDETGRTHPVEAPA